MDNGIKWIRRVIVCMLILGAIGAILEIIQGK